MTPQPVEDAFTVELARQMRIAMDDAGLKRKELSERSEIPYRSLKRYLDAEREIPAPSLRAIASAVGVSAGALIEAAEDRL